jgi:hypothetical protein
MVVAHMMTAEGKGEIGAGPLVQPSRTPSGVGLRTTGPGLPHFLLLTHEENTLLRLTLDAPLDASVF